MFGTTARSAEPTRILVTGATGTLGYNTVRLLAGRYRAARITVLMRSPHPNLFADLPNVATQVLELLDTERARRAIASERPQAIVHCAASGMRPSQASWFEMVAMNVRVTLALFEAACELAECHFIHVSTGLVYREQRRPLLETDPLDPVHPYGASKAAADSLLRSGAERLRRRLTIVRPFSFTGLHDRDERLFPSLLRCAQSGEPFAMSAGLQVRDFSAVGAVARAICLVLQRRGESDIEVYNVGCGNALPLRRIVEDVCVRLGLNVDIRFGARALDPLEPMHLVADVSKLRALGWHAGQTLSSAVRQLAAERYKCALTSSAKSAYG